RFIAEWWIRRPHVERRIAASARPSRGDASKDGALRLRASEVGEAPAINRTRVVGEWLEPVAVDLSVSGRRLTVAIPVGFTDMLSREPDLALAWRLSTRQIFTTYFARGYRAVDFFLDRE